MAGGGSHGRVNKKLARRYNGNTRLIKDHEWNTWNQMEPTVVKEAGGVYRRPRQMHMETLAGPRCVHAFRRGQ